jgi:2',3'-cyclic-nucleotide 2'-phosphodiesterase / 3'-nucleotidase
MEVFMQTFDFKIIYTSDVHGQLSAHNFALNQIDPCGLSRIKTYLDQIKTPFLLLDNGDFLQGSVMLDYHREIDQQTASPVSKTMNLLGYDYYTLGNHDFNYGMTHLKQTVKEINGQLICANIFNNQDERVFSPYEIKTFDNGLRIGIIGAVTHYIPHWEKPKHIEGIVFKDAYQTIKACVHEIKDKVDLVVVLYHGGFEKNLDTGVNIGRLTDENQGYAISQISGIDVLLTGHQHVPIYKKMPNGMVVIQTGLNAFDFGQVDLSFIKDDSGWHLQKNEGCLIKATHKEHPDVLNTLESLYQKTQNYLDEIIGTTKNDMRITDPLSLRAKKHPLIQMMNDLQLALSGAEVSAASLPNQPIGLNSTITLRDLAANFIYPNTFVKLEIAGEQLKKAIERTAEYYTSINGKLSIDDSFLYPKVEHYNVDIFDGIEYVIDARKPKGDKLISCTYKGAPLKDDQKLTIVLNNYRAIGGGDYPMYASCKVIASYDVTLFDLFKEYIVKHQNIDIDVINNYTIIY